MIAALISETKLISASELYRLSKALQVNARHLAEAYMLGTDTNVVVIDKDALLPKGCFPIVFVEEGGSPGTLGEHWFDNRRDIPAARVMVQNATALNTGPHSVSEIASHELLEAIINERVATWMPHPRRAGVEIAYEVCDPTQDSYVIKLGNNEWNVSNFVTPFFWMPSLPQPLHEIERDFGYGIDWCKRLTYPGEISSEGYAVMRETANPKRRWSEDMTGPIGQNSSQLARKQHHSSRTQRLLAGA